MNFVGYVNAVVKWPVVASAFTHDITNLMVRGNKVENENWQVLKIAGLHPCRLVSMQACVHAGLRPCRLASMQACVHTGLSPCRLELSEV